MPDIDADFQKLKDRYNDGESTAELIAEIRNMPALQVLGVKDTLNGIEAFWGRDNHDFSQKSIEHMIDLRRPSPREQWRMEEARRKDLQRTRIDPSQEMIRKILLALEDAAQPSDGSVIRTNFFDHAGEDHARRERRSAAAQEIIDEARKSFATEIVRSFLGEGSSWSYASRSARSALRALRGGADIVNVVARLTTELGETAYLIKIGRSVQESANIVAGSRLQTATTGQDCTLT